MSLTPRNFRASDIVVIAALWTLLFYDDWLTSLFIHTADVIYGESKEFHRNAQLYVLVGKCILACVLAVVVDAYNHKYAVAFGGMCLYTITPVLALTMCITEKQELLVPTLCASSLLFVTSPAAFGVIFNQNERPVRIQVRRLVAIMEFVQGMLLVMVRELIPDKASHSERNSMVASWVVVIPLIVFIITILEQVRKYVRREELKERGVVAIFKGIQNDISGRYPRTGLGKLNALVFVLLLLPAFSFTSLETVVSNLKPSDDTQFQHPSLKRIVSAGQLTIIPVTEVAISYAPLRETTAELLVLGMAHVLNIGVLAVLCVRIVGGFGRIPVSNAELLDNRPSSNQNTTTTKSPFLTLDKSATPQQTTRITRDKRALPEGQFLFFIINHSASNLNIEDPRGLLFNGSQNLIAYTGTFHPSEPSTISGKDIAVNLKITATETLSQRPIEINQFVTFKDKMFRYIGIWGRSELAVSLAGDDVDIPQIIDKFSSMIIVQNTIVGNSYFGKIMHPNEHEFELQTADADIPLFQLTLPHYSRSITAPIQSSNPGQKHILRIRYKGDDPTLQRQLKVEERWMQLLPSKVYVVSFGIREDPPQYIVNDGGEIYEVPPTPLPTTPVTSTAQTTTPVPTTPVPTTPATATPVPTTQAATTPLPATSPPMTRVPFMPEPPDVVVSTSFGVLGATLGMTTVGYIHFFWMEAPLRLRTALYAWFIVCNELLSWFTSHIIGQEVGVKEAIILLSIAVATAIWHFAFAWYFERSFKATPELSPRRLS